MILDSFDRCGNLGSIWIIDMLFVGNIVNSILVKTSLKINVHIQLYEMKVNIWSDQAA